VDATLAGIPVIQVLPPGVHELLPHGSWGLAGTACSEMELESLLRQALDRPAAEPASVDPRVLGDFDRPAVERIVEETFALCGLSAWERSPSQRAA
jgi:hypothetical protein